MHNETETELSNETSLLKDKLIKERIEFLSELNRGGSSKRDLLEKFESKFRELEEIILKEKKEREKMEEVLHKETEQLHLAKEKQLKELEEQKNLRESELEQEINNTKKNLQEQIEQMNQFIREKEETEKTLREVQLDSKKSLEELKNGVTESEKQVKQSGEVISSLQEQLEKDSAVKCQLQSVENEEQSSSVANTANEDDSKSFAALLSEVENIMENELKCGICSELFIEAVTLGCMHTFCQYCITAWKKNKMECAICRTPIDVECKSLSLDTFIDKMLENLTEEARQKRQFLLNERKEEVKTLKKRPRVMSPKTMRRLRARLTEADLSLAAMDWSVVAVLSNLQLLVSNRASTMAATSAVSSAAPADTERPPGCTLK